MDTRQYNADERKIAKRITRSVEYKRVRERALTAEARAEDLNVRLTKVTKEYDKLEKREGELKEELRTKTWEANALKEELEKLRAAKEDEPVEEASEE